MREILDFIVTYYRYIIAGIGFILWIILLVVAMLRRRTQSVDFIDNIKVDILSILPSLINLVERPGSGADKLEEVVLLVKKYLTDHYHLPDPDYFTSFIIESVEDFLSTPSKKKGD